MTAALVFASTNISAAPVSWVANDGLWQTPANWSSNPSLPGAADDVTIDRPGTVTVTLSAGTQSIRSILSEENLIIGGGSILTLAVGAGGGQFNGALTVSPGAQLISSGGVLQSNGSVTADSGNLRAENSGDLNLPNLITISAAGGPTIIATGTGSNVNMQGVASFSGGTGFATARLLAEAGGAVNLSNLTSITSGAVEAIASGANSTIDFSMLTNFSPDNANGNRRLRAVNGGRILTPNLTTISGGTSVELGGAGSMLDLADLTSADNLNLRAENGAALSLPAAITSYSGSAGSTIHAVGTGASVSLPGVTSLSGGTGFGTARLLAEAGGTVNLSSLTSITSGAVEAFAAGAGSTIDFSMLTNFSPNNANGNRRLRADNGGRILTPNLTTIGSGTSVELSGATSMLDLADLTSANNLHLRAETGATLSLPASITSYSGSAGSTIHAVGAGASVNLPGVTSLSGGTGFATARLLADAGGTVNLNALTSINSGAVEAIATGAGSTIDFSMLTTFSPDNANGNRRLRAVNGGRIVSPNLTTIGSGTNVELSGAGSMLDLADLASADNLNLRAESGATLSLPSAITSYSGGSAGTSITAVGTGSRLNMPGVTSLSGGTGFGSTRLVAEAGGTVNFSALTSITSGAVDAIATGAGSTLDFPVLTTFSPNNANANRRLRAENGGRILTPNLTTIGSGIHVELSGATSTLDLANLTSANDLNLRAESGATLSLPATITSYSAPLTTTIIATGMNSSVNLPGVTSLAGATGFSTTRLLAEAGGTVNLGALTSITSGAVDAFASGAGSTLNLSSLTTFSPDINGVNRRLRAENGGTVRINSAGTTTVMNSPVELNPTGTIMGDTLQLGSGATLSGNGLIDANYSQAAGGTMRINIGGLTPDTQFDQLRIDGNASLGGTLQVALTNNLVPVFGQSFEILQITGTRTGEFDIAQLPSLTGGLQWNLVYNPQSVVLEVENFYGDYSGNGVIDAADYVVWRNTLNATGINQPADGDQNRVVNQLDYDFWRARFGQTSGSGAGDLDSAQAAVPEPSLLVFGAQAVLFLVVRRRERPLIQQDSGSMHNPTIG
jgi:hypothetical protein